MTLRYKNDYIKEYKNELKILKQKKEEFDNAFSDFFRKSNEFLSKSHATENIKVIKKICKKNKSLDYQTQLDMCMKNKLPTSMNNDDLISLSDEDDVTCLDQDQDQDQDQNQTQDIAEKNQDKEDNVGNNENLFKEIKIDNKTYYVDINNGGTIYDENISKVGEYDGKEYKIYS